MKSHPGSARSTRRRHAPDEPTAFPPTSRDVPMLELRGVNFRTSDKVTWEALQAANGTSTDATKATGCAVWMAVLLLGVALLVALAR